MRRGAHADADGKSGFWYYAPMKLSVHLLELRAPIRVAAGSSPDVAAPDGTRSIDRYESAVGEKELEPAPERHLVGGEPATEIPAGFYLFAQLPREGDKAPDATNRLRDAAEAVWLESLWRNMRFTDATVLVRTLREDGKDVRQVFRAVEPPSA